MMISISAAALKESKYTSTWNVRAGILIYLLARLLMAVGSIAGSYFIHPRPGNWLYNAAVYGVAHNDSYWYSWIATDGYHWFNTAYFPLYPLLIHAFHAVAGSTATAAGLIISNLSYVLALIALLDLLKSYVGRKRAVLTCLVLSLWPYAYALSSQYTEPLYILLLVMSLRCLRDKQWILAGLWIALASVTRNEGILLLIPYCMTAYQAWRSNRLLTRLILWGLIIAGLGDLAYGLFLWAHFGSPFIFMTTQKLWGRSFMFPVMTIIEGVISFPWLWVHNGTYGHIYYSFEILALLISAFGLVLAWRTKAVPKSWILWSVVCLLVPLSDPAISISHIMATPKYVIDYFFSYGRFMLPVIPIWIGLSSIKKRILIPSMAASSLLLIFCSVLTEWHWFLA